MTGKRGLCFFDFIENYGGIVGDNAKYRYNKEKMSGRRIETFMIDWKGELFEWMPGCIGIFRHDGECLRTVALNAKNA